MGITLYLRGEDDDPASESLEVVLRDMRSAFQQRPTNRADASVLLDLYGSIISLCARAQRIRAILAARLSASRSGTASLTESGADSDELAPGDLSTDEIRQFDSFNRELMVFGSCLTEVNLAAIDIYFPGLKEDLLDVTGRDLDFSRIYVQKIAPKYGLADRTMPAILVQVLDGYSGDRGPQNVGEELMWKFGYSRYDHPRNPRPAPISIMLSIIELLEACRTEIGGIIRENWRFRDLLDRRSAHGEGIYVGQIDYNISGSQVGAVGPGAHVHDVSFHQQVHSSVTDINAQVLAEQLERLLAELVKQATERDHYAALVAVSDAAADAREGKVGNSLARLAAVGRWVADIAKNIGVNVATEAIKKATGLS